MVSKIIYNFFRQKVQQAKDPDIIKYTHFVEDVVEELFTFNRNDVGHAHILQQKLEDMMDGVVKSEEERVKELEE